MSLSISVNKFSWWLMFILSTSVAASLLFTYLSKPLGASVHPDMKIVFEEHPVEIYTHIFASFISLVLGPIQFSNRFRKKYVRWHRLIGRVYLLSILLGGTAGLYMAQFAFGGMVSQVGFFLLALLWLFTGAMALRSILNKSVDAHRKWMVRNFSLTFGAVNLRIYLGLFFAAGLPFEDFYPLLAWLSWVPNILIAEWIFNT